jgi:hypothetical protein
MGFYPHKILHLVAAKERGLGTIERGEMDVSGVPIESIRMKCAPMTGAEAIAEP